MDNKDIDPKFGESLTIVRLIAWVVVAIIVAVCVTVGVKLL